ncbi:MAG: TetR/AcrR family transcriptional regulator, partial [Angelakisella sp.]
FKSKEDIMQAVSDEMDKDSTVRIAALRNRKDLTGLQKMRQLAMDSMDSDTQATLLSAVPNILKNPRFLAEQIYSGDRVVAPLIEEFIREGIVDGSITTDHPKEASQILILLLNIWLNPLVFSCTQEELLAKFRYLQQITTSMLGTPILDDSILERLDKYRQLTCGSPASSVPHPTK